MEKAVANLGHDAFNFSNLENVDGFVQMDGKLVRPDAHKHMSSPALPLRILYGKLSIRKKEGRRCTSMKVTKMCWRERKGMLKILEYYNSWTRPRNTKRATVKLADAHEYNENGNAFAWR